MVLINGNDEIVNEATGDTTRVFLTLVNGHLFGMVRCADESSFDAQALAVGLLEPAYSAIPEVYEFDGSLLMEAVQEGPIQCAPGVIITRIGEHILERPEYDSNGNVIKDRVVDPRFHANFWLDRSFVARDNWQAWARVWTNNGEDAPSNNEESAKKLNNVELIDPDTVKHPRNLLNV